jgi:hypothetical protein
MSVERPGGETAAAGVDVARIMEEIRGRVAERKAAGVYSDEALEEIAHMELRLREREEYGVEMDRLISWLHAHWEATGPRPSFEASSFKTEPDQREDRPAFLRRPSSAAGECGGR